MSVISLRRKYRSNLPLAIICKRRMQFLPWLCGRTSRLVVLSYTGTLTFMVCPSTRLLFLFPIHILRHIDDVTYRTLHELIQRDKIEEETYGLLRLVRVGTPQPVDYVGCRPHLRT